MRHNRDWASALLSGSGLVAVQWTSDVEADLVYHMRIDHCGSDVLVPEELLERPDVIAISDHLGGEGVPKRVAGCGFYDVGCRDCSTEGPLHCARGEVIAAPPIGRGVL